MEKYKEKFENGTLDYRACAIQEFVNHLNNCGFKGRKAWDEMDRYFHATDSVAAYS